MSRLQISGCPVFTNLDSVVIWRWRVLGGLGVAIMLIAGEAESPVTVPFREPNLHSFELLVSGVQV